AHPATRRADVGPRPRRPPHGAAAAGAAAGSRRLGAAQLAPPLRDRARLRPGRDPARRRADRRGHACGAVAAARRRARDGCRHPPRRGRAARGRAAADGGGRGHGPQRVRRARAHLDARGGLPRGRRRGDGLSSVMVIAGYGFREAVRRKVFLVVLVLTALFLFLFWVANHFVFRDLSSISPPPDVAVDTRTFAGAFLVGLAMFATLFLGVVLAVFLTIGVVSGDAERGLLQPLVVRPVGRSTLLLSRFLGAALVCVAYVLGVYFGAMAITGLTGHWWPDRIVWPGVELAVAVVIVIALSLLGSVALSSTANGIGVFMLFGAGLVAGLLGTIGHALNSHAVKHASTIAAWALPFDALYQDGLRMITENASGLPSFFLQLAPFGRPY